MTEPILAQKERNPLRTVLGFCLVTLLAVPAAASDGVIEINQACATTGCFAGDAAGYPITITAEGSYRLTSDLVVPPSTNGIEVASNVGIDLNQFSVRGPVVCNPCSATGAGSGIVSASGGGSRVSVQNGRVRGFGLDGISLATQARVEGLTIGDVARHGVSLGGGSYVEKTLINAVGGHGIEFRPGFLFAVTPSLYRDNAISNVGQVAALAGQSVLNGRASGPNVCTDQLCGTTGSRFFYLTTVLHNGATADTACSAGFHMASLWELFDTSGLEYDTARGRTQSDSGQGPPSAALGWIRTGYNSSPGAVGQGNCLAWSSSSAAQDGSTVNARSTWTNTTNAVSPWEPLGEGCDSTISVWCMQD